VSYIAVATRRLRVNKSACELCNLPHVNWTFSETELVLEISARCCAFSTLQCAGSTRMYSAPSLYAGLSPVAATPPAAADDDGAMDADESTEQQQQQQQHSSVVVTAPAQLQVSTTAVTI
jgi:hypothetical protein